MTVAYSSLTVRLKLELPHPCASVSVSGSIPELGSWSLEKCVKLYPSGDGSTEYTHSLLLSDFVSSFKFRYLAVFHDGSRSTDLRRSFYLPRGIVNHGKIASTSKVFVDVRSMWNEPNSALSVFVPAGPLSVRQDMGLHLLDMKRMIEELRYEKEALREDIIAWSSSSCLFGSSEMRVDSRISEHECNKRIRDLLFQVNDLKGKVKVVGRFRPLIEGERVALDFSIPNNSSVIINGCGRAFELDEVFDADVNNESFYEKSKIKSVVESSVLISNNVCIFSYGQTNSGKTHTVIGSRGEKGIVELTLESIFGLLEEKREKKSVEIEMIEIYRESVFQLIECTNVKSKNQTMEIFLEKVQDRATASTFLNPTSSRSHCVFIISLVSEKNTSYIFLVDLAGSERTKISGAEGDRLAEANSINKSLSTLGLVLNSLLNKRPFIPYRDSKLTKILAPVFATTSPPSKVVMIANVSPNIQDERETLSTLQFAQRVGEIELRDNRDNEEEINRKINALNDIIEQQKLQLDQLRMHSSPQLLIDRFTT